MMICLFVLILVADTVQTPIASASCTTFWFHRIYLLKYFPINTPSVPVSFIKRLTLGFLKR